MGFACTASKGPLKIRFAGRKNEKSQKTKKWSSLNFLGLGQVSISHKIVIVSKKKSTIIIPCALTSFWSFFSRCRQSVCFREWNSMNLKNPQLRPFTSIWTENAIPGSRFRPITLPGIVIMAKSWTWKVSHPQPAKRTRPKVGNSN